MLLINILGIATMGFVVWWFWLWKPKAGSAAQTTRKSDSEEENSPQ